jgi:hypothetical protein
VHHASWDRDVEALGDALAHLAARPRSWDSPAVAPAGQPGRSRRTDAERVVSYLADGSVVTVLNSGVHAVDRDGPWLHGAGTLPDTAELARHLAGHFRVGTETDDLARVSQHVALTEGRVDLYRALRDLLVTTDCEPSSAHRFIARLPGRLRDLGRERYQLVVTTNYDSALERAFDAAHEPYDLVVFVATGEHRGRFVHVPWWDPGGDGPRPSRCPTSTSTSRWTRTGHWSERSSSSCTAEASTSGRAGRTCADNFVITEDDYIGYLTQSPVSSLIPLQVLNKIRDSHFLFMGYRMRDWTLRVFLQRIWGEQQVEARSWAVEEPGLDVLERELWDHIGVHVVEATAGEFLTGLERELGRLAGTGAER